MLDKIRSYYYNYNWPLLTAPILKEPFKIIVNNLLPFTIFAPQRVGQALHGILALGNIVQNIHNLRNAGNVAQQLTEIAAHFFNHKLGLIFHHAFGIIQQISPTDPTGRLEKVVLIASNAFSLTPLLKLSKENSLKLSVISALVQTCSNFYLMYQAGKDVYTDSQGWRNLKLITLISKGLLGVIHLAYAHALFKKFRTFQSPPEQKDLPDQTFILMRHADKVTGTGDRDPSISEDGKLRAKASADVIKTVAKKYGKQQIKLISSPLKRSRETAACIAEKLGISSPIEIEERIKERESLPSAKKKKLLNYEAYKKLPPKKQFYSTLLGENNYENREAQYKRMTEGVNNILGKQSPGTLPVLVGHTTAMSSFFEGLSYDKKLQDTKPSFLNGSKFCEFLVVGKQKDLFIALERILTELPPK